MDPGIFKSGGPKGRREKKWRREFRALYIYKYIYFRNESSEHNDPEYSAYYVQWLGIKYITVSLWFSEAYS